VTVALEGGKDVGAAVALFVTGPENRQGGGAEGNGSRPLVLGLARGDMPQGPFQVHFRPFHACHVPAAASGEETEQEEPLPENIFRCQRGKECLHFGGEQEPLPGMLGEVCHPHGRIRAGVAHGARCLGKHGRQEGLAAVRLNRAVFLGYGAVPLGNDGLGNRGKALVVERGQVLVVLPLIVLPRFSEASPWARTSKGFLITGIGVAASRSCPNRAARGSAVPAELTQFLSPLQVGQFKSRRQSRQTFGGWFTQGS
jgi:hypothetical protein